MPDQPNAEAPTSTTKTLESLLRSFGPRPHLSIEATEPVVVIELEDFSSRQPSRTLYSVKGNQIDKISSAAKRPASTSSDPELDATFA